MRTSLYIALFVALGIVLTGCGIQSYVIRSQALSYDDVIEDTTDKLLLLNILRAKDKAPLHFDEIPSIHESIQTTASLQASWPFGPRLANANSGPRNMVQSTLGVQVTPTFEIDHLDTKDFVTGIASPIDPKFVKYWLDRGLDRRLVLLMFFSAATITETDPSAVGSPAIRTIRLVNSPRDAIDTLSQQKDQLKDEPVPEELRCDTTSDFQHYLKLIDSLKPFSPQYFKEPRLLAERLRAVTSNENSNDKSKLTNWQAIASLDADKFQWIRNSDGTFNVYALSTEPTTTLCPIETNSSVQNRGGECIQLGIEKSLNEVATPKRYPWPSPPVERRAQPSPYCDFFNGLIAGNGTQDLNRKNAKIEIRLEIRSVGEMIQFLGDLLEYQEELAQMLRANPPRGLKLNNPLTFGYCADEPLGHAAPGCDDIFFNLPADTCNSRFSVSYRGRTYAVPNYNAPQSESCQTETGGVQRAKGKDHTLEVLSVVHQMVDLQKSAQDIRETPYVQVLP